MQELKDSLCKPMVSMETFQNQFFALEGVRIILTCQNKRVEVPPYDYTVRLGNNKKLEALYERVRALLEYNHDVSYAITSINGTVLRNMEVNLLTLRRMRKMTVQG